VELSVIVDSVGWEWLIAMMVFFAFTVWWGFGAKRRGGDGDDDAS